MDTPPLYARIYAVVRQIPSGQVASYGQIARIVGGISGQLVGFALAALSSHPEEKDVPWQRVINAQGKISPHGFGYGSAVQRQILEEEGLVFSLDNTLDLEKYGWALGKKPPSATPASARPQRKG
jgi:methylated-DNA-protein-cysteine methyltransferase related protein